MLSRNRLLGAGRACAGTLDTTDPRVSPINGIMEGLPTIWITAAGDDMLVLQGRRLRDVLQSAHIDVHYREDPHMIHLVSEPPWVWWRLLAECPRPHPQRAVVGRPWEGALMAMC